MTMKSLTTCHTIKSSQKISGLGGLNDLGRRSTASGGFPRPKFREAPVVLRWARPKLSFGTPFVGVESIPSRLERNVRVF